MLTPGIISASSDARHMVTAEKACDVSRLRFALR